MIFMFFKLLFLNANEHRLLHKRHPCTSNTYVCKRKRTPAVFRVHFTLPFLTWTCNQHFHDANATQRAVG